MENQPEARHKAKRLADYIAGDTTQDINAEIAQELRRLHAENERLRADAARLDWLHHYMAGDADSYFEVSLPENFDVRKWIDALKEQQ